MKIVINQKKEIEIDVNFPIYRKQDISGNMYECIMYTKILNERKQIKITRYKYYAIRQR